MTVPRSIQPLIAHRRILIASLAGTSIEFYDFYIYATAAALVFGPLFFPVEDASAQLLLSFASLGLAFVARPVGAALFGHFGDRVGRKSTLVASLMLMGGSTILIAFLPTYAQIGWYAPLLLCLLRFGQGLGLGGEWGGASLLAVENAPPGWEGRFGMFPPLGAPIGFIAANGFFLLLGTVMTDAQFLAWGWRLPFLASALLVFVGLWVRLKLVETPAFAAATAKEPPPRVPILDLFRHDLPNMLVGTFGAIAAFALFYIATAWALGYGTTTLGYSRKSFLLVELMAIPFLGFGVIVACILSDLRGAAFALRLGFAGCLLVGALMGSMIGSQSITLILLWLIMAQFIMGFTYGPLGGWLPSLFGPRVRYTGVSLTFNLGGILGGALAPIAAQALAARGGPALVGVYLVVAGVLSFCGLIFARRPAEI